MEITADIQDAIAGSLNSKYDLHISREFTMGRAIKKLGEILNLISFFKSDI